MILTIESKQFGRKQSRYSSILTLPEGGEGVLTVRQLLHLIVQEEVRAFNQRENTRQKPHLLTPELIADGAQRGKVGLVERDKQSADAEQAFARAIEAFQDGLYFLFINGQQQKDLDQPIPIANTLHLMFLRLTALVGG